jgi:hypothetical protein
MALSRTDLEIIAADVTIDEGSREKARQLLAVTEPQDTGSESQLAEWYRTFPEPQRHTAFENGRKYLKHSAFSLEAEARPARADYLAVFGTN